METPTIASSNYTTTAFNPAQFFGAAGVGGALVSDPALLRKLADIGAVRRVQPLQNFQAVGELPQEKEKGIMTSTPRRLVQVYIADPNEHVPLADSMLYTGEQKLTDLTDQELFFEVDIKTILAAHNEKRVKMMNKSVKERTEYLEPAKIRELKMVVVNIASF